MAALASHSCTATSRATKDKIGQKAVNYGLEIVSRNDVKCTKQSDVKIIG
jgi:hypothetical protein